MPALVAPPDGVVVRFYRIGHGDCFLFAMPKLEGGNAYILIDCGYKPGSPEFVLKKPGQEVADRVFTAGDIAEHVVEACGGHLDVVVITHEHQDHVNGFTKFKPFLTAKEGQKPRLTIGTVWCAWTEKPGPGLAQDLRDKHKDVLLGVIAARNALAMRVGNEDATLNRIDEMLMLDLGIENPSQLLGADNNPADSLNKKGMKLIKDHAQNGVEYFEPGDRVLVPGTAIQAYVIGPPMKEESLLDEKMDESIEFPSDDHKFGFSAAALSAIKKEPRESPFAPRFRVTDDLERQAFEAIYGVPSQKESRNALPNSQKAVEDAALWRQIEGEWLYASESLALVLNKGINNTSLVLAFELPKTKKVLLFVGDAQSGSWKTWHEPTFKVEDGKEFKAKDLLARTVLYKVGHHGSHNATLNGTVASDHANLGWMAQGQHASEFTAMITAVRAWAMQPKPKWNHPLPAIKDALLGRCSGRVIQTDALEFAKPPSITEADWKKFTDRLDQKELYFDFQVHDRWS